MQIKVCGITDRANMMEIATLRPDFMGFIFYSHSPRDVTHAIEALDLRAVPGSIDKVAVLVNHPLPDVIRLIKDYCFEAVQLHGDESPDYCHTLNEHCMVIKSFAIAHTLPGTLSSYEGACDVFLFDTAGKNRGGNGVPFNWDILGSYTLRTPFFLSGGVSCHDAVAINKLSEGSEFFAGVDINSQFETRPGYKDVALIKQFMGDLRT